MYHEYSGDSARKATGIENIPIMMRIKNHSAIIEAHTAKYFKIEKNI